MHLGFSRRMIRALGPIWIYLVGFGVWEVSQSIGNCLEIDLDEFSAREVPYSSIFEDVPDFRSEFMKIRGSETLSSPCSQCISPRKIGLLEMQHTAA